MVSTAASACTLSVPDEHVGCFNCHESHDKDEMSHCLICDGYSCMYCSCNCVTIDEDSGD
jgi:hypothetical protein